MRHFLIATAALATFAGAMPAHADTVRAHVVTAVAHARPATGRACAATLGSTACAAYQAQVLVDAANRVGPTTDPVAMKELGRRQLDALIASVQ